MIPIIAYHSIDNSGSFISIAPSQFEKQMHYLWRKKYRSILLRDFLNDGMKGESTFEKHFILTFDDGYRNNYNEAFPILMKYGFTATIFIVTQFVGMTSAWIKDKSVPVQPLLAWDEIMKMTEYGIDFQPHSKTHADLTILNTIGIEEEIISSKREIEEQLRNRAEFFCYPYGRFDKRVVKALKLAGFKGAVTSLFGWNYNDIDPFIIKRIGSRRFRKYPKVFRLCLSRLGCHLVSLAVRSKKGLI